MDFDIDKITKEQIIAIRQNDKPNHRQYWTDTERQQLVELYESGVGISVMAVIFQRSERAVSNQINKLGLIQRTRSPNKDSDDCKCPQCPHFSKCKPALLSKEGDQISGPQNETI